MNFDFRSELFSFKIVIFMNLSAGQLSSGNRKKNQLWPMAMVGYTKWCIGFWQSHIVRDVFLFLQNCPLRIYHSRSSDLPQLLLLPILSFRIILYWFLSHCFDTGIASYFFFSFSSSVFVSVSQTLSATSEDIFSESGQIYLSLALIYCSLE